MVCRKNPIPIFAMALGIVSCRSELGSTSSSPGASKRTTATSSILKVTSPNCKDPDLSKVLKGETFMRCDGSMGEGTYEPVPETHQDCRADGATGCITTADFPAVARSALSPSDLAVGFSIGGMQGTKWDVKACRSGRNILASATDPSVPWNGSVAGAGTVAVVSGSPVVNGTGTNFTGKVNVGDVLSVAGETHVVIAVTDMTTLTVDGNFSQTVSGQPYSYFAPHADASTDDSPSVNDVVYTGAGKTNCNEGNFADVTATASPLKPDASKNPAWTKIHQDRLTGTYLAIFTDASMTWTRAIATCHGLNGGTGGNGWRLATQKEAMQLYIDGLHRYTVTSMNTTHAMVTSSTVSFDPSQAWLVASNTGTTTWLGKTSVSIWGGPLTAVCVRP